MTQLLRNDSRRLAVLALGLYAVALSVRLATWRGDPMGWETAHFMLARELGQEDPRVGGLYAPAADAGPIFWSRPAFYILLHPISLFSFDAARLFMLGCTSLLAPLSFLLLRRSQVSLLVSGGTGLLLALHPAFFVPGAKILSPSLAAVVLAGAMFAHQADRRGWARPMLVVAPWIDEAALLVVAALLFRELWVGQRSGTSTWWPFSLTRDQTALVLVLALGALPFLFVGVNNYYPPFGLTQPGELRDLPDRLLLSVWVLPLLTAGLAWPRTRGLALLSIVMTLSIFVMSISFSARPEPAVAAFTGFFAVLALGICIDEAWHRRKNRTGWFAAALAVLLVASSVLLPAAAVRSATQPLTTLPTSSMWESVASARSIDPARSEILAALRPGQWSHLVVVDVPWYEIYEPFFYRAQTDGLTFAYTTERGTLEPYVAAIEGNTTGTVLVKSDSPLSGALSATYEDCLVFENAVYALFDGAACEGGQERLRREYDARVAS